MALLGGKNKVSRKFNTICACHIPIGANRKNVLTKTCKHYIVAGA
jgi:hypothetical protein